MDLAVRCSRKAVKLNHSLTCVASMCVLVSAGLVVVGSRSVIKYILQDRARLFLFILLSYLSSTTSDYITFSVSLCQNVSFRRTFTTDMESTGSFNINLPLWHYTKSHRGDKTSLRHRTSTMGLPLLKGRLVYLSNKCPGRISLVRMTPSGVLGCMRTLAPEADI